MVEAASPVPCAFHADASSWLNLVERWFREITDKRIRRGTFHNVKQLQQAIRDYIAEHNEEPKAFKWTAKADVRLSRNRIVRRSGQVFPAQDTENVELSTKGRRGGGFRCFASCDRDSASRRFASSLPPRGLSSPSGSYASVSRA